MAETSGSQPDPVKLREKIARSREMVSRDMSGLTYELNFPLKFRRAFQHHTALWIGGAVVLGLAVALLKARTKKVYVNPLGKKGRAAQKDSFSSNALSGALKLGFAAAQPVIVSYFAKRFAQKPERPSRDRRDW
jgi:hypothetical protein